LSQMFSYSVAPHVTYWLVSVYYLAVGSQGEWKNVNRNVVMACVLSQQMVQTCVSVTWIWLQGTEPNQFAHVDWYQIALRWVVAMVVMDTHQYWMHRLMHTNQWLYTNIHSVHHRLLINHPYAALYNHPLELVLLDSLGAALAMFFSGLDGDPFWGSLFLCFASAKTVHDHCGTFAIYRRWDPFHLVFTNNATYHDVHHALSGRKKNFSQPFFTFWDVAMGTAEIPIRNKDAL